MAGDLIGLTGMGGAAGAGDAIGTIFEQRMKMARLAQDDALTRLRIQELTDARSERLQAKQEADQQRADTAAEALQVKREGQARLNFPLLPTDRPLSPATVKSFTDAGLPQEAFAPTEVKDQAPPPMLTAPDQPQGPQPVSGTIANSPQPSAMTFHRMPTTQETQQGEQKAAQQKLISLFPIGSRERSAIEYETATGKNAPSSMFPVDKSAEADRRVQDRKDLIDYANAAKPPKDTSAADVARVDRSYNVQIKRLDALEKPLADQAERIGRLRATINQNSPTADALIAPELLTAMAGGQGSGLRMTEAEISRIVGGRNQWQTLKARLEAWQADPTKPFSVTPEQRKQMRDLVTVIAERGQRRLSIIDEARSHLSDANDVGEHRRLVDAAKKALNIETGGETPATGGGPVERWGRDANGKPVRLP